MVALDRVTKLIDMYTIERVSATFILKNHPMHSNRDIMIINLPFDFSLQSMFLVPLESYIYKLCLASILINDQIAESFDSIIFLERYNKRHRYRPDLSTANTDRCTGRLLFLLFKRAIQRRRKSFSKGD